MKLLEWSAYVILFIDLADKEDGLLLYLEAEGTYLLARCLVIFTVIIICSRPAAILAGGGSMVVAGDAFGKYYGGGFGETVSGWSQSNPFGISQVLSGPTIGFCTKNSSVSPSLSDHSYSGSESNSYTREPASYDGSDLQGTTGEAIDPNKDYSKDMQGVINALRDIQVRRCRSGDTSIAQCDPRSPGDHSSGRCWQAVKIALKEAGVVNGYLGSASAVDAHRKGILKRAGFCQVQVNSSRDAPKGAILVYRWNQNRVNEWNQHCSRSSCRVSSPKYGHIEVKGGDGEYLSDIKLSTPMDQSPSNQSSSGPKRSLEAVYVKGPCHES